MEPEYVRAMREIREEAKKLQAELETSDAACCINTAMHVWSNLRYQLPEPRAAIQVVTDVKGLVDESGAISQLEVTKAEI